MRDVLIIGCGWLGVPLARRLVEAGHRVIGTTMSESRRPEIAATGARTALLRLSEQKLETDHPDDLFNVDTVIISIPPGRRSADVEIRHPAEISRLIPFLAADRICQVVFISSTSVYAPDRGVVAEEDAGHGDTPSGRALYTVETTLRDHIGEKTTIVRFGGLLGDDRHPVRQIISRAHIRGGAMPVNLIAREDCIRILMLLVERVVRGRIYNACCDGHPTRREFYTAEADKLGLAPPLFVEEEVTNGKIVSSERLKHDLGYEFVYTDPRQVFPTASTTGPTESRPPPG